MLGKVSEKSEIVRTFLASFEKFSIDLRVFGRFSVDIVACNNYLLT